MIMVLMSSKNNDTKIKKRKSSTKKIYAFTNILKSCYALISTSTPLGNSNFINASTVLEVDE